jgi:predicted nucleic acid-binding protein
VTFLDTRVIIDFLAGDQKIVAIVKEIYNKEDVKTTTITEYELLRHKTKIKKQAAERFLSCVIVSSFDRDAARKAAELFQELQDAGRWLMKTFCLLRALHWRMMRFY